MRTKRILIVAAHPDDEVLGCGGTIARLIGEGCAVQVAILGEGITSRADQRDRAASAKSLALLRSNMRRANAVLGIRHVSSFDLPDNRFDTVPLLDVVKIIERLLVRFRPEIVFTHAAGDLNNDHRITHQAVMTAARPLSGTAVREIYGFYIPSSTEWQFPMQFAPTLLYDITRTLPKKLRAMRSYAGELRTGVHPRSLYGIEMVARYFGIMAGSRAAEPFEVVRIMR